MFGHTCTILFILRFEIVKLSCLFKLEKPHNHEPILSTCRIIDELSYYLEITAETLTKPETTELQVEQK